MSAPDTDRLSAHFTVAEFSCHDGTRPDEPWMRAWLERLCRAVLEPIREAWGGPVVVVSGYRTPAYNADIGGAERSQHCQCTAADIRPEGGREEFERFRTLVVGMVERGQLPDVGGLGTYPAWVHVDIRGQRPGGHIARWTGHGIGSEAS